MRKPLSPCVWRARLRAPPPPLLLLLPPLLLARHATAAWSCEESRVRRERLISTLEHGLGDGTATTATGTCLDELTAKVDQDGLWYARLSAEATRAIANGDSFALKDNARCKGAPVVADLTVSPRISRADPVHGSYAHVGVKIDAQQAWGRDELYVCIEGHRGSRPCLAMLRAPRMSNLLKRVRAFAALAATFMKNPEAVKALDDVSVLAFASLEAVLLLVCALLFTTLTQALLTCARLSPSKPVADLRFMEARNPFTTLTTSAIHTFAFVAGIFNLVGASLPSMIKTANPGLLVVIYVWPCTFGVYVIVRLFFLTCSIQRYEAGLLHNKLILAGRVRATMYNAIALAGVMLLFACIFAAMAYNPSADQILGALVIAVSPALSIVKCLFDLWTLEQEQQSQLLKVTLDLAGLTAGPGTDALTIFGGRKVVEISEGAFCNVCRNNSDPLPAMEETSGECSLDEGREFGFGDYRWHARYIYHATGSRVAFFNVPISLLFVAMLVLSSMQWFLQCRAILPAMQRVEVGGGLLVPAFQPERKFYSLYYDAASSHLEVLHSLQQETTNQVSMSVVRGKYQTSNVSGDLAQIDLRNVKGPWELQILARGMWGHVREYLVQLLPVSTVLRSVVLRSKYRHRGWTACVRRSAVGETSFISGAPLTFDIEVATEEFVFSRPEEPGGRGSGGGDIYMRFSASNGSAMSCTERCLYRSSCRSAWDGVGGCFFGMVPEGGSLCGLHEQRSAADVLAASASPYRDFLRSRAARTSVRMCFQDEQGGGPCTVVQSNGLGKTVIPNIRVSPSGSMLEVEVVRSNKAGRLVSVASQAFQVRYGAARVLKVLAFAKGVRMDVAVDGEGRWGWQRVSLRIRGMDFSALSDPFPITIVPLLDDHHFHVVPEAKQRGIDRESSSFRLADDCVEHPELHRFTVCGGTQRIGVVTVRVPKWEPLQHQFRLYVQRGSGPALEAGDWSRGVWVHINSPPTYAFPAEMAVERQCSVVFKEPPEIASRWLSPGVFQHGLESCGGKNITFEASGVSVLSPWRFFLMGITMYSGQLARFLHLALQSAARSDDGSRFEHKFDKLAEITPNKFGVDIKIPARVPQEFAVWVPWKSPQPLTWNLNVDELLWSRLAKAAYFVCVRSKITRRTALRLLLGMAHGEIRMYGTLARCIQKKRITLGVPLEHQSPEFQAVRLRQPDVLEALARTRLLADAVGTVVTRGREVFYAARAVEDLVVAHGISALGTRRTLNLTAMGLTEREVPGIVDLIYKADVRRLDISWNRLGLRGIERLLGRLHELAKTRLTIVRVGHNVNASDEAKKQRTSRYQFLAGLHGLQELDLSCSGVGASSATELEPLLAAMPGLKILNLSSNNLGDEGLTVLAATLGSLRALRSLDISCNNVSSAGLRALNATALGSLEALHISGNLLGEENCNDLANALAHMALLRHLSVGSNGIGVAGAASIGHILGSLVALQTFDVSQNPITEMGLVALRLARLPKLLALDLSGTALGEPSAATLAATLHALPNLKTLRLDSNGLGAGGVVAVVRALPGRLTGLSLGDNSIGASSGGNSIGVSASGKTISVSGNSLGAGEALAQALRNLTQLRHVDVRHNDLRTADLRPVCLVLESIASLRTLRIQDNDFSSDASDLWRCLAGLRRVRHLDISGNHIFSSAGPLLRDGMKTALAGMWRLETLVIHGNRLPRQVLTDVMDHMVHLIDEQAINLKLMQVRGVVPVPGDLLTEGDLLMLRGIYTWILLA